TNVFIACSGFLVGIKPFVGKLSKEREEIHKPGFYLWIPVVILSGLTLLFGLLPRIADNGILRFAYQSVARQTPDIYLKIWHGFNPVLIWSMATIFLGVLLFVLNRYLRSPLQRIEKLENISPQSLTESFGESGRNFAFNYTRLMHNGYRRNDGIVIIIFIALRVGYRLFTAMPIQVNTSDLTGFRIYDLTVFVIIVISIIYTIRTTSRLTAIASVGIMGYGICLIFVFYGAPDLAMTQFTIDTLTAVLFVLVLFKLPPFLTFRSKRILYRDAAVSLSFGILIMLVTLQSLVYPASKEISRFYAENAYT